VCVCVRACVCVEALSRELRVALPIGVVVCRCRGCDS